MIGELADSIARQVDNLTGTVSEAFMEPVIRVGVTGLARAGKTVFITSLVANLLNRGRMGGMAVEAQGRIEAAYLQPQPDDTVPRFQFEEHLSALTGGNPLLADVNAYSERVAPVAAGQATGASWRAVWRADRAC